MKKILFFIVLLISIILGSLFLLSETYHEKNLNSPQQELILNQTENVLKNTTGELALIGWSKSPKHFNFNKSHINPKSSSLFSKDLNKFRYKKWEALVFTSEKLIFTFAPFDLTYVGGYILHYFDFTKPNSEIGAIEYVSLLDKANITDNCVEECLMYNYTNDDNKSFLKSTKLEKTGINSLKFELNYKDNNSSFKIDAEISRNQSADSLVTLTPISEDLTLFYYNLKQNLFVPNGTLNFNNKDYNLSDFLITYDSGRGVWPLKSGWFWANGNGRTTKNQKISINMGHGFNHPNASKATEDSFFIEDRIFKLPSMKTVKPNNSTKIWKFTVSELVSKENLTGNTCTVEFKILSHKNISKDFVIAKMSFDIYYGQFSGICKDLNGNEYLFEKVYGILEEKRSIW